MDNRIFVRLFSVGLVALMFFCGASLQAQSELDETDEIVYIDSNGYIRVLDPFQTADNPVVKWRSPDGGWYDAALGDFNADGDDEIAAIGPWTDDDGVERTRLTIYDPVVAEDEVQPGMRVNGIGWATLFTETVPALVGGPVDIAVGKFSATGVMDGIVISTVLPDVGDDQTPSRVTLLSATSDDGRSWETRFYRDFRHEWDQVRTGNANNVGLDEVVLVDDGLSVLSVYRIDNGMTDEADRIFNIGSESRKWNDAIVAVTWEGMNQLIAVRDATVPLASFLVFQYQNADDEWIDLFLEPFVPPPLRLFAADVNASGDDEIFMLRDVPSDITAPRLFMRQSWSDGDPANPFEATLDSDNGFREGAGGNIIGGDGGKDEIVIIRDNFIRIYTEPESNQNNLNFGRTTDLRTVVVGDLDAAGFSPPSILSASPESLIETIDLGVVSGAYDIDLINTGFDVPIPFTYTVQGDPAWISVSASSDRTPATLQIYLDATKLLVGDYSTAIEIDAADMDIENPHLTIPILATVEEAIFADPDHLLFVFESCDADTPAQSQDILVAGPDGQQVMATIDPSVPWATVEPSDINLPALVSVTVAPDERNVVFDEAVLVLAQSTSDGLERSVPIYLICADHRTFLPAIAK